MKRYEFDVRLFSILRVDAQDEADARQKVAALLAAASLTTGLRPDGSRAVFEVAAEGEPDLMEVRDIGGARA